MDFKHGIIAIKGTKTKYDRYMPINHKVKAVLMGIERKAGCSYIFHNKGVRMKDFKYSFYTACRNAGGLHYLIV